MKGAPVKGAPVKGARVMLDLNTATAAELDEVPQLRGHGFEIVRVREERGGFTALRQLDEVPGLAGKWDGAEDSLSVPGRDE